MKRLEYKWSEADQLVRSRSRNGEKTVISIYTDDTSDMLLLKTEAEKMCKELRKRYKIKDLGDIKFVLSIQITCDQAKKLITLDQEKYMKHMLKKFSIANCTLKYSPLSLKVILSQMQAPTMDEEQQYMKNKPYSKLLGSLMYAQIDIHFNIGFAITSLN